MILNEKALDLEIIEFTCFIQRLFPCRTEMIRNQNTCTATHAAFSRGTFLLRISGQISVTMPQISSPALA